MSMKEEFPPQGTVRGENGASYGADGGDGEDGSIGIDGLDGTGGRSRKICSNVNAKRNVTKKKVVNDQLDK